MERYKYIGPLGEGAYGEVWKCQERSSGRMVAIKHFKQAHLNSDIMKLAVREVHTLQTCRHPNIVSLLDAFRTVCGHVYVVLECVEHTLTTYINVYPRGLPPFNTKLLMWQLISAVQALHSNKILHRDIKPANILVTEQGILKLCDFSFARTMHAGGATGRYSDYVTTRWYRAPEVIVTDVYGPAVDVWAIGCVFAEMITGRALFRGRTNADQLHLILQTFGTSLPLRQLQLASTHRKLQLLEMPAPQQIVSLEQR
ncbi:MAG: hypothetical protein WDW36_000674 [Sanguina aurantia]